MDKVLECEVLEINFNKNDAELLVENANDFTRFKIILRKDSDLYKKAEFMTKGDTINVSVEIRGKLMSVINIEWFYDDVGIAEQKVINER